MTIAIHFRMVKGSRGWRSEIHGTCRRFADHLNVGSPLFHLTRSMTLKTDDRHRLYLSHRPALIDYAARILGSREAAEDIVQEAYLRFIPGKAPAEATRLGLAYLYRIVRNLAFDLLKRRQIEDREHGRGLPFWTSPQFFETPEEMAMLESDVRIAAAVLDSLPDEVRTAVEMYRFGGHTLEAVAEHLGISVATAHRHVRSTMVKIAIALDRKNA